MARAHQGMCASCGRQRKLVGRNPDGAPWCDACYRTAAAARLAARRRAVILVAVAAAEPALAKATVLRVIDQMAEGRRLGQLADHLHAHPDVLTTGPTSLPPVLDRFVDALITAGAKTITTIHPTCQDCGRTRPAHHLPGGAVICSACYARRTSTQMCAGCGQRRRPYARDQAGHPRCRGCTDRVRAEAKRTEALEQLTSALAGQVSLDRAQVADVLAAVAPRGYDLRVLAEQVAEHRLTDPGLPFVVARLAVALRAAGADLPGPPCQSCQQPCGSDASVYGARVRCRTCVRHCPGCARPARREDERVCGRCRRDAHRRRGSCAGCNEPGRVLDDRGLCRWCRERAARRCADCHQNRALTIVAGHQLCDRCALRRTVDGLLVDRPPGALYALRAPVLAAEPMTTRRWLRRPAVAALLAALDSGRLPLTHATLDAQPASRAVEHLRDLLLATGALAPDRDRLVDRFQHGSDQMLAALDASDARIVRSWLRWQVLPRLRRHQAGPVDVGAAVANARRTLRSVIAFLATIEAAHRTLASAHQGDIDSWFASPRTRPHQVRPFLAWARRTRVLPAAIRLPPSFRGRSELHTDPEQRWSIARRLVQGDTTDTADRVAGALGVLYAQTLVRICALTTDDIATDGAIVTVRLGGDRLELPEPFATLIQSLPQPRRHGVAEQIPGDWLFPGQRAGLHLAAASLGRRLRTIAIEPRRTRLAALDQLSAEIPPAMLAGVLGLKTSHVVRHTTRAGGDWAQYAADRAT
ncbi:hypothetical protein [Cellulomonas sp. KRMCY2]|uniref:hypothetical protein n=1 Tax=Cellulomonas sp. KRMCY2 TaxID=1304865 RepID=UPI0004B5F07B|nr:hypothetical protein [Cellulomonas sp. KRMCY2]